MEMVFPKYDYFVSKSEPDINIWAIIKLLLDFNIEQRTFSGSKILAGP